MFVRSASGVSSGSGAGCLATGSDSPVSAASAASSAAVSSRRASRAHGVASAEQQHVARHEFARLDALLGAATEHAGVQAGELAQRLHRAFRATLLKRADERVEHHHDEDDDCIAAFSHDEGDRRGDKENADQRTRELPQHDRGERPALRLRKGVWTVCGQTFSGFRGGKSIRSGTKLRQRLGSRLAVQGFAT